MIKLNRLFIVKITIFFAIFFSCGNLVNNQKQVHCEFVRVVSNFPVMLPGGELYNALDSFDIYYFKDFITYKFPYLSYTENEDSITGNSVSYQYFIFKKNEKRGFFIDQEKIDNLAVDSFLIKKAFYKLDLYKGLEDSSSLHYLKDIERDITGKQVRINFFAKTKVKAIDHPDTIIYYLSDNWKNLDYSLSKELDKKESLKLYKYRAVFNSQFYDGYDYKFPHRELLFEIKPIPGGSCKDVLPYIERIESLQKKYAALETHR